MASYLARLPRHASALTLTCLLGAAGCSDTTTPSLLAPSAFPGSPITSAFLGDDKLAFSDSGAVSPVGDVRVFRNVANEDAILVYESSNNAGAGTTRLFASYYNGRSLTAPVEILGAGERPTQNRSSIKVLFLNTGSFSGVDGTATSNGRARNGDALIVYVGNDSDDVSSAQADDRDSNDRVYATYFDKSAAGAAASGTIIHGFETLARPIDFDHVLTGGGNDHDAIAAGFASDSLHGTHGFGSSHGGVTLSGDATTFAQILVLKDPSVGGASVGRRWFAIPFDLGQAGNAFVAQSAAMSGQLDPAMGILEDGDTMGNNVIVADGLVASQADNVDAAGEDRVVTATIFSQAAGTISIHLGSDPTADRDRTELPRVGDLYGPDHGVGAYYAFFTESEFTDGNDGSRAADRDLMLAQIDVGSASRFVREIDAYTAPISTTDGDMDGVVVRDGDGGGVGGGGMFGPLYSTRVHRDGSFISVYMAQPSTEMTDLDDADANAIEAERNLVPYLQVVQTGRSAADLATSTLASALQAPALLSSGDVNNGIQQRNALDFAFQVGVPDASAAVLGGPNQPADAWQRNANRIFFRYTQHNDQNGAGNVQNEERLFTTGLEITAGTNAATAPSAVLLRNDIPSALVQFPNTAAGSGSDDNWNNVGAPFSAQVVDRGTAAGEFLTIFLSNDNNVPDSSQNGAYEAERLYVWDGSATQLLSSAGQADWQTVARAPTIVMAGDRMHLVWTERSSTPSSELSVVARSIASDTTVVTATPALTEAPTKLDLVSNGGVGAVSVSTSGSTVGVYMEEGGHVYYTQTTTDAAHYRVASGLPNPTLVDNDSAGDIQGWTLWNADGTSPMRRSFFVYQKSIVTGGSTDERLYVRIHD